MSYKSLNGLMRHLRNQGIDIRGTTDKRLLRNSGYFHGYKGYRFLNNLLIDSLFKIIVKLKRLFDMIVSLSHCYIAN
mgnify:CR=1 FL=1